MLTVTAYLKTQEESLILSALNGENSCIKPTYCVKKQKYREIDWHLITTYGQTIAVITESYEHRSLVKKSAWRFRKATGLNLKLMAQTSTYLLFELKEG